MLEKFKDVEDYRWLKRYIKFLEIFGNNSGGYVENHHILPKSIYKEFSDLKKYSWNSVKLSAREHYIAHYMLGKALGGKMWYAWHRMRICNGIEINSILFEKARIEHSKVMSKNMTGRKFIGHSEETIEKIREARFKRENRKGKMVGKNHFKVDIILIYNSYGNLEYFCNSAFKEFCEKNSLPLGKFKKCYMDNISYSTRNKKYKHLEGYTVKRMKDIKWQNVSSDLVR
jgi:hypothetical protein